MDGLIIGLNHLAIWKVLDEFEIEDKKQCFMKVLKVFSIWHRGYMDKREEMKESTGR